MTKILISFLFLSLLLVRVTAQQKDSKPSANAYPSNLKLLDRLSDVKKMDEAALRVFIRIRVAEFLWESKEDGAADEAKRTITDALADLQANEKDVPGFYGKAFLKEAFHLLYAHAPELADKLSKEYGYEDKVNQLERAYEQMDFKGGAETATNAVRNALQNKREHETVLIFILDRLRTETPEALQRLLADVIADETNSPGHLTLNTLFKLKSFCLSERSPIELKVGYLVVILRNTGDPNLLSASNESAQAYNLLRITLPAFSQ